MLAMIIVAFVSALCAYTIGVGVGESRERERIIKAVEEEAGIHDPANHWINSGNVVTDGIQINGNGDNVIDDKVHRAEHGEPPEDDTFN